MANINDLIDACVTSINAAWAPSGNDSVSRVYLPPVNLDTLAGRKVYLFPVSYSQEPASRTEDLWSYTVAGVVVERYTSAGEPTRAWVDARVDFVEGFVSDGLDFGRSAGNGFLVPGTGREAWTERITATAYDWPMLNTGVFFAELEFEFREILSAVPPAFRTFTNHTPGAAGITWTLDPGAGAAVTAALARNGTTVSTPSPSAGQVDLAELLLLGFITGDAGLLTVTGPGGSDSESFSFTSP